MQKDLFKDMVKMLKSDTKLAFARMLLKRVSQAQAQELVKKFPQYYRTTKAGAVVARSKRDYERADLQHTMSHVLDELAPQVLDATKEKAVSKAVSKKEKAVSKTVVLGGYGHLAGAERECQQFLHPNVFQYQSAIFPDPRNHGVKVRITSAIPVTVEKPTTPLNPWGVQLALEVMGDNAATWLKKFEDRIRIQRAT